MKPIKFMDTKQKTKQIQSAVGVTADGIWGANSANAVFQALGLEEPKGVSLWYPEANTNYEASHTHGKYEHNYPKGAIVHYTSGWWDRSLDDQIAEQVANGYTYFVIDEHGNVAQNFPLDEWGYHAGKSSWSSLDGTVSDELVGIEICCAGKLESDGTPWFTDQKIEDVRVIETQNENQKVGIYQKYTEAQEAALTKLLLWLHSNNPSVFDLDLVLGHDEVSPDRKDDPSGSLSMTMPAFRNFLKSQ